MGRGGRCVCPFLQALLINLRENKFILCVLLSVKEYCKVIFPYEAQNEDELTIKEGDIVTLVNKVIQHVSLKCHFKVAMHFHIKKLLTLPSTQTVQSNCMFVCDCNI